MLADFNNFVARNAELNQLNELSGAVVAIEASFFLQLHFEAENGEAREPLVPALGGLPSNLESSLKKDLQTFKELNIRPLFVFDGLDAGKKFGPFDKSRAAAGRCDLAWSNYHTGAPKEHGKRERKGQVDGDTVVKDFGESGTFVLPWRACPTSKHADPSEQGLLRSRAHTLYSSAY